MPIGTIKHSRRLLVVEAPDKYLKDVYSLGVAFATSHFSLILHKKITHAEWHCNRSGWSGKNKKKPPENFWD